MNIVDIFQSTPLPEPHRTSFTLEAVDDADADTPSTSYDRFQLSLEPFIRQAARGRGAIVAAQRCGDALVVATARGYLLRYAFDEYGNEKVTETEVYKASDSKAANVFVDPTGSHVLVCVRAAGSGPAVVAETFYLHRKWAKAKPLPKLKGTVVTAVGWQQPGQPRLADGEPLPAGDATTDALLGTDSGTVLAISLDEVMKKDSTPRPLLELRDRGRSVAVCSLAVETARGGQHVVLAATPAAFYLFSGGPKIEDVFSKYAGVQPLPLLEAGAPEAGPGAGAAAEASNSQLALFRPAAAAGGLPARFTWLVGRSLFYGHFDWRGMEGGGEVAVTHLGQAHAPPDLAGACPLGLALSEYHALLLYPSQLLALNAISGRVAYDIQLTGPAAAAAIGGMPLGASPSAPVRLSPDSAADGAPLLATADGLYEVSLLREASGMWRVMLEFGDAEAALRLAAGPAQRDAVYRSLADRAFAEGKYEQAAQHYGRVLGSVPPFEEVALRLSEVGDPGVLAAFLKARLSCLGAGDRVQATMTAAWLTELYLDQINRALLEAGGAQGERYKSCEAQLRSFLTDHVSTLDVNTTLGLLAAYGRTDDLVHYAAARGDWEALLEHLTQRPGGAARALAVLRKPSVPRELTYRFAPGLLVAAPEAAVDLFVAAQPPLEPRRLLPALLRGGEADAGPVLQQQVLRYLGFAIEQLRCTDSAVHNLSASLHALAPDEGPLLSYLAAAKTPLGGCLYDPRYVLRLARQRGCTRAVVALLQELRLWDEAVEAALQQGDLDLAKSIAAAPEEDDAVRRKLWLRLARHVVAARSGGDETSAIRQGMEFLKEAGGLLQVEDILPLFPDFATIDNFRGAITDSLQRHNRQLGELKRHMDEATDIAEDVRRDLKALQGRVASIRLSDNCARCGRPLFDPPTNPERLPAGGCVPPLYAFPSGLAFHGVCCAAEVLQLVAPPQTSRIMGLLQRLSKLKLDAKTAPGGPQGPEATIEELRAALAEEIAAECPRNGDLAVNALDKPFVNPDVDQAEAASWAI